MKSKNPKTCRRTNFYFNVKWSKTALLCLPHNIRTGIPLIFYQLSSWCIKTSQNNSNKARCSKDFCKLYSSCWCFGTFGCSRIKLETDVSHFMLVSKQWGFLIGSILICHHVSGHLLNVNPIFICPLALFWSPLATDVLFMVFMFRAEREQSLILLN